jgi:hypothetical protein
MGTIVAVRVIDEENGAMARNTKDRKSVAVILQKLRSQPTVSIPEAGFILSESGETASYDAARNGTLGVSTFESGGKIRARSADILKLLNLQESA